MNPFPASGTIAPGSFPRLVADLYRHGATGSLRVEGTTYRKALYFRNGRILFGSSNDPRDQLGAILVATGRISEEEVENESQKVGPGKPLARVLADGGIVGQKELAEAAQLKVERILADLLSYAVGIFEFEDGVLPKGAVDLRLSTPRLFLAAARGAGTALTPMVIGPGEQVLRRREGGDAILSELDAEVAALARAFDGIRSVGSVGASLGMPTRESESAATALVLLGLAEHINGPSLDATPEPFDPFTLLSDAPESLTPSRAPQPIGAIDPASETIIARPASMLPEPPVKEHSAPVSAEDKTTIFPPPPMHLDFESPAPPIVKTPVGASTADLQLDLSRARPQLDLPLAKEPELDIRFDPDPEPEPPAPAASDVSESASPSFATPRPTEPPPQIRSRFDAVTEERHIPLRPDRAVDEPPGALPPPSLPHPTFHRPQRKIQTAHARRSSIPGLLVAPLLLAGAGAGLWLWLNISSREPATSALQPSPSPTPREMLGRPAPTVAAAVPAATPTPAAARSAQPLPTPTPAATRRAAAEALPTPPPPAARATVSPRPTPPAPAPRSVVATSAAAAELLRQGDVAGAARAFAVATPREGYTVQLLVACAPQTAVNAAQHAPAGEVFVLPIVYGGRDCFRVAYGRYASETAAAAALASAVPDYFKTDTRPRVESLAKIVP